MLSGEEVASIPVEEASDVKALKQKLNWLHGLPSRFRQRLFLSGNLLDDSCKLDSGMVLELVLLTYLTASGSTSDELIVAAARGSTCEAGVFPLLTSGNHPKTAKRVLGFLGEGFGFGGWGLGSRYKGPGALGQHSSKSQRFRICRGPWALGE